ncbi:hypothetical protein BSKO_04989 [Bryopsis sp. KO-2023]|nr:hypothetical protein BSKO_04989 [Bryopsis sp. KO-2023]
MEFVRITILLFLVWGSLVLAIDVQEKHADPRGRILELRKILQDSDQQEIESDTGTSTGGYDQPDESSPVLVADESQPNSQVSSSETTEDSFGAFEEGQTIESEDSQADTPGEFGFSQSDGGADGENSSTTPDTQFESGPGAGVEENQEDQGQSTIENSNNSINWLKETLQLLTEDEAAIDEIAASASTPAPSLPDSSPAQQGATDDYYANRFRATQENDITELDIDKESFAPTPTTLLTVTGKQENAAQQTEQQNVSPGGSFG